jgi:hypothetical protein
MPSLPMMPQQPQTKAQSARQTDTCPTCGSENYLPTPGNPNVAKRCFDCGYPTEQAGSQYGALTGARVEGTAPKPATGNSTGGYHPDQIIGKV